ncbi:UFM1 specific peptidase 1 isoform X1 [Halictus rubicundus]|uniref:UFM1 specific peptidase 1 isoform X1 n=2 Tax=Halictus rubicundus TaxID=77578 RepID=UPI004035147A
MQNRSDFRRSNGTLYTIDTMIVDYTNNLLENVHRDILPPEPGRSFLIRGDYEYWHYGCDGFNDKGWGCGYRTLQTICSWVIKNQKLEQSVPSIGRVQEILVTLEDKERSFIRSREWIGSFEVCLVLNHLYEVLSKIIHVPSGKQLSDQIAVIKMHFENYASPIMMGGDRDCSSKCIVGVHEGVENTYMLIVDPHFVGQARSNEQLQSEHWVKWQNLKDFVDSSFYNLCLPQIKGPTKR